MRRALFIAAVLLLAAPAAADAAVLSVQRAERLALAEAKERATQEKDGGNVSVDRCTRRSVRTVSCKVSWRYVEEFDHRETVDCEQRDDICSVPEERTFRGEERNCTADVSVRNLSPRGRRLRVIAVLTGQECKPFFDTEQD
jgi:hypothetical protein